VSPIARYQPLFQCQKAWKISKFLQSERTYFFLVDLLQRKTQLLTGKGVICTFTSQRNSQKLTDLNHKIKRQNTNWFPSLLIFSVFLNHLSLFETAVASLLCSVIPPCRQSQFIERVHAAKNLLSCNYRQKSSERL